MTTIVQLHPPPSPLPAQPEQQTFPKWLVENLLYDETVCPAKLTDVALDLYYMIEELQAKVGVAPTAPTRRRGGRPTKSFMGRLAGFGGGWLAANGCPDTQAQLERALLGECARCGWEYSESSARELAADLIAGFEDSMK